MAEFKELTLDTLARGALPELFREALDDVVENVRDPNTYEGAKRTITIKVTFSPSGDRETVAHSVQVTSGLAPHKPADGMAWLGRRGDRTVAVTQDPRQGDMFDEADPDVRPLHPLRDGTTDQEHPGG